MDLARALAALADAVAAALPGVTTYDYVPDSVTVPAWYCGEVAVDYDGTFGGDPTVTVTCRLLVGRGVDGSGQRDLSAYLGTGPGSVWAALQSARGAPGVAALGGAVDDLAVPRMTGHRLYTLGPDVYLGAEWPVQLIGDGDA